MRIVMFYHSLVSDWNHGNAHFLRGIVTELLARGHDVRVYEPHQGWSRQNFLREAGPGAEARFHAAFPQLRSRTYNLDDLDLDETLDGANLVLVHEWNDPALVERLGQHRAWRGGYLLLFHDTHHRLLTAPQEMNRYDLRHFDGVLAYGKVLRDLYLADGRAHRVWTWHEAADVRLFRPRPSQGTVGDLIWIGNWGDDERSQELFEFLIEPARCLGLKTRVYGVRYPESAKQALADAGIEYCGWIPNYDTPSLLSQFRVTVHIPRRPYVEALPGIPTIRVFEALACGIPLVCSPWNDAEHLFEPGEDYLVASSGREMTQLLERVLGDDALRRRLAEHGLATIQARHTCAHRVDELLTIVRELETRPTQSLA